MHNIYMFNKCCHLAATLPCVPPIPPPPLEELTRPMVPPRTNYPGASYAGATRGSRSQLEPENDFEPCFLMQTATGSVFLPPGGAACMWTKVQLYFICTMELESIVSCQDFFYVDVTDWSMFILFG